MTPELKIKHMILMQDAEWRGLENPCPFEEVAIEGAWDALIEDDGQWDAMSEVRNSGIDTGLPCEWSRHYESKAVAAKCADGSWVGWTYWYGGGKHSDADAIDWMDTAYDLTCTEEEKLVVVRTFEKVEKDTPQ